MSVFLEVLAKRNIVDTEHTHSPHSLKFSLRPMGKASNYTESIYLEVLISLSPPSH